MNRRNIIIIGIGLAVVIIITAVWWFFIRPTSLPIFDEKPSSVGGDLPQSANIESQEADLPSLNGVSIGDPDFESEILKRDLGNRTRIFVERLMSYSSDSDLTNMTDLYFEMTDNLENRIALERDNLLQTFANSEDFIGFTVSVVTIEVINLDQETGSARIKASAQKEVTRKDSPTPSIEYVIYELAWQRQDDNRWLINALAGQI